MMPDPPVGMLTCNACGRVINPDEDPYVSSRAGRVVCEDHLGDI